MTIDLPTMLAEVLEFYHMGWGETVHLDFAWFCKLYKRIPMLQARRLLPWLPVISYPDLPDDARGRIHEMLMQQSGLEQLGQPGTDARVEAGWAALRTFAAAPAIGQEPR